MRNFDKVWEKLRETTSVQEINELKEYFVNEYPEIFCAEEMNIRTERTEKHNKKIKDVKETLLTSISMEPFINYEGIENDKTLSTLQEIVPYQKAIDDTKRRHIYFAVNQGKLLEKCFIHGKNFYKITVKENGLSRQWVHFLWRLVNFIEEYNQILYCAVPLKCIYTNFKIIWEICKHDPNKWK